MFKNDSKSFTKMEDKSNPRTNKEQNTIGYLEYEAVFKNVAELTTDIKIL